MTAERLTKSIEVALLAALAYVLTLIAVPILPVAPYLKLDLSDLPILVATATLGISAGLAVAALSIGLHLLLSGFALPMILGDAVLLTSAVVIVLTVGGLISWVNRSPTFWRRTVLVVLVTFNLTWTMALVNWLAIPLYMKTIGLTVRLPLTKLIGFGIVPFNLIKGVVVSGLFLFVNRYLRRSKWIK